MVKSKAAPVEDIQSPDVFEKKLGKFEAKGLVCFEEITDYSLISDKKVRGFEFWFRVFKKVLRYLLMISS